MKQFKIANSKNQLPVTSEPLWKNFPTRDKDGKALSDFMLIFPGFKKLSPEEIQNKVNFIYNTLNAFNDKIEYASLNLKNYILMISVKPLPGIQIEITSAIQSYVPEAKLVTHM
ncbi:MAG: hypothetical protein OEZ34_10980 [Spirochaetia bacterium]|nr:hypothetical protein [Spirochaetia bacterium]